jgi:hypothetical protein
LKLPIAQVPKTSENGSQQMEKDEERSHARYR